MNKLHQTLLKEISFLTQKIVLWQRVLLVLTLCLTHQGQAAFFPFPPPTPLIGVSQLWAGGSNDHSCVIMMSGGLKCWGWNLSGQLGDGTTTDRLSPINVKSFEINGAITIALGHRHSCTLTTSGGLRCWGWNSFGQLGNGSISDSLIPINVSGFETSGAITIALGDSHSCALTVSSGVQCWGANYAGQLGDNSIINRDTPVNINGLTGVIAIALGHSHSCALTMSGGVKCWGENSSGQLGDATTISRLIPVNVNGFETSGGIAIALGDNHSCVLTTGGGVKCWGSNSAGQLGNGTTINSSIPVNVNGFETGGASAIALGGEHSCVLTTGGGVRCWGLNSVGQLGDGTTTDRSISVNVNGFEISGADAIALGKTHSCALLTLNNGVKCWGYNLSSQLGDGTTIDRLTPVNVIILPNIEVQGNNIPIPSGQTTTNSLDYTDFGSVRINTQGTQSFIIHNTGGGTLNLFGSNSNIICSSNITPSLSLKDISIEPLLPYSFSIGLTPHALGSGNCVVTLVNNDPGPNKNPYTFAVSIQGIEKPTIIANLPTLTRFYGSSNPALLPTSYTGWVNGVEPIDFPPTLTTSATLTSPPGTYPITCSGGQDNNYFIVCGPPGTLTIAPANTTTSLIQPTPTSSISGTEVVFKFVVNAISPTTEVPTGNIEIRQGSTPICQASFLNGLGTCTAPLNGIGPQVLTATYLGNTTFQGSTSKEVSHFLLQAAYASTPAPGETIDFGTGPVANPLTTSLTIKEMGNQSLKVTLQNLTGDPDLKILTPFPLSIANGDPESFITLTCTPRTPGLHTATLELSTNDPLWPTVTYPLTCEGQPTPGYASSPPLGNILEIGNSQVGQSVVFTMKIEEVGAKDLQVNFLELTGPHASDFQVISPTFPFTLKDEAHLDQSLEIRCIPSDLGKREALLKLTSNDPQHPNPTYPLECQSMSVPTAGYNSLPERNGLLNFGTSPLGQPIIFKLNLMETGNAPLTVELKELRGPQAGDFSILSPDLPLTISDGALPQWVMLRCIPSALGLRMAELELISNDPKHPSIMYSLQCLGDPNNNLLPEITQIKLSHQTIALHTPPNYKVGTFQTEVREPSPTFRFRYHLIEDAQGTFKIFEDQLILAKSLAFEKPEIYQIIVKSTEENSGVEKNEAFIIHVNSENHAPTEIQLSHDQVGERTQGLVGKLTTQDPDIKDTHTYTLASGGQFILKNENEIHVTQNILFKHPTYLIRVTSTDAGGLSVNQEFTLHIQPEPQFYGGAQSEGGSVGRNIQVDEPESVTLTGKIQPSAFHVGQLADLMIFYHWTSSTPNERPIDGSHVFAHQKRLETLMIEPNILRAKLVRLVGIFKVRLGYRIGEETWSESEPFSVEILPDRPPRNLEFTMNPALLEQPLLEGAPEDILIGTLSMEDPDHGEEFYYKVVDKEKWRGYLKMKGNQLFTGPWYFLGGQTYEITVRGIDLLGLSIDKTFELKVLKDTRLKEPNLTHAEVIEGSPSGTVVGRFFLSGPGEDNQYRLLEDAQGRFTLRGDILVVNAGELLDFETQSHHEILVEVSKGDQRREKRFSIEVLKVGTKVH